MHIWIEVRVHFNQSVALFQVVTHKSLMYPYLAEVVLCIMNQDAHMF